MDQGRLGVGPRLAGDPVDAIAATVRTAHGIEASLTANARRLLRPAPIFATLVGFGDAIALLITLSVFDMTNSRGLGWLVIVLVALNLDAARHRRPSLRVADDVPVLAGRLAMSLLLLVALSDGVTPLARLVAIGIVALAVVAVGRLFSYSLIRAARRAGHITERVLLVGETAGAVELAATTGRHPEFGMTPVGFVTYGDSQAKASSGSAPLISEGADLCQTIREMAVSRVIIALDGGAMPDLGRLLEACQSRKVDVYMIPPFAGAGLVPESVAGDDVLGIPLIRIRRPRLRTRTPAVKRAIDVAIASLALCLTAPLLAGGALAVRLSSPGPIFFRQERIGRGGRPFSVYKFRTMRVNTDSDTTWSVLRDRRVTPVGKLLRNASIDELPQLLNVLKGEMSLIGPRPERPHFVDRFAAEVPGYARRHRAAVGITGWAQVHGLRGDTSIADRVRLDNYYIEHWSLWLDLVIMLRTIKEIVRGVIGR